MDTYAKRPKVTRFNQKKTYAGRTVKRTLVLNRARPGTKGRKMRPMKALKRGVRLK